MVHNNDFPLWSIDINGDYSLFRSETRSYVSQADFELQIFLPLHLKCWDYRRVIVYGSGGNPGLLQAKQSL